MSLRVKVELILFITFVLVIGLGYGIQRFIIIPELAPLERETAENDMHRSVEALDAQVEALKRRTRAWAADSPLIQMLQPEQQAPANSLAAPDSLSDGALTGACLLDSNFRRRAGYLHANADGTPADIPEFDTENWSQNTALPRDASGVPTSGVALTSRGPALVAANAVIDTSAPTPGTALGYLVTWRLIDQDLLSQMHRQAAIAFQIWPVNDPALSPEERAVLQELIAGATVHISEKGDDVFRVYASYPNTTGKPVLLLRSEVHRGLLARAQSTMRNGLLAQVGIGLAALVVLIILFRRIVTDSLTRLTRHATDIGQTNDLSARIVMERTDELGTLSQAFNSMVSKLQEDRQRQLEIKEQLRESEERYALAVRGANDGLWDWNLVSNEMHYSDRWKAMLGFEENEIAGTPAEWFDRIHPEDRENVMAALEAHKQFKTAHFESEHRIMHQSQTYLWVLCRGLAIPGPDGQPLRMAGSQTDITLRKVFEEQLRHQALHDSLTSLPNRALFLDRLNQALKLAERQKGYQFAVLFIDLNRFKVVNDGLGHVVGDALLNMFAEKLQGILRAVDTVCRHTGTLARFGGDEFVVLLDNITSIADATLVARRIERTLEEPFQIDTHEVYTSASIGIAMSGPGYGSAEELIRNADTAMYRAKTQGGACFEIFDADMHSRAMERLTLENDLRHAIDRGEFLVYYQPIVSLKTGRIIAFESLIRWMHPERGLVPPVAFIPVAEETGMIVPIGEFILREACRQLRTWQKSLPAYRELKISVNLSVKEFSKPDLIGSIADALTDANLDPAFLKLEITESALMDSVEFVTRTLRQLRKMGIQLAIDDFGTGYSSLSYLHRFPMHTLKVDQSFIRDMDSSPESEQIVRTVILLAQALSMNTIAEGIEEAGHANTLRLLECDAGQGYYFSRPLDTAHATALLERDPVWFAEGQEAE